ERRAPLGQGAVVGGAEAAAVLRGTGPYERRGAVRDPPVVAVDGLADEDAVGGAVVVEVSDQLDARLRAGVVDVVHGRLAGGVEGQRSREVARGLVGAPRAATGLRVGAVARVGG